MAHTYTDISTLYAHFNECSSVVTDTRKLSKGSLFFALKGPNFDGNTFAEKALEKGARYAVVSDPALAEKSGCLLVKDTLRSLQELANHHRRQLSIPVIGITGSNGKTTTKELIQAVLSSSYRSYATKGNLNNHIGVPLTLLNAPKDAEILVVEMGANQPNDIAELCDIAEPNHGLITNIGKAHLEGFGGEEGILKAKSQLYQYLIKHDGTIFINRRQPALFNMSKRVANPILYPEQGDFYHCEVVEANPFVQIKAENGDIVATRLMGMYNFDNIATALCVAKYFKVADKDAHEALENYTPSDNRSQIIEKGDNFIILDAYNANPSSMRAAIENFAALQRPNKVLILGDMLELGRDTVKEHLELGRYIAQFHFDKIYLCGIQVIEILKNNPGSVHFETREMLLNYLKKKKFEKSSFLIKGSRSMGLEAVTEYL